MGFQVASWGEIPEKPIRERASVYQDMVAMLLDTSQSSEAPHNHDKLLVLTKASETSKIT